MAELDANRRFLREVLSSGLASDVLTPEAIIKRVTADVLAENLPAELKAKLIQASLDGEAMDPTLIVETLGVDSLATHAPIHLLWAAVADVIGDSLGDAPSRTATEIEAEAVSVPMPADDELDEATPKRKPNRRVDAGRHSRAQRQRRAATVAEPPPAAMAVAIEIDYGADDDEADFDSPTAFGDSKALSEPPTGFEKNTTSTDKNSPEPGARDRWVDEETNPGIGKSKSVLAKD